MSDNNPERRKSEIAAQREVKGRETKLAAQRETKLVAYNAKANAIMSKRSGPTLEEILRSGQTLDVTLAHLDERIERGKFAGALNAYITKTVGVPMDGFAKVEDILTPAQMDDFLIEYYEK